MVRLAKDRKNKTLYLKAEDQEIWDDADMLTGGETSVSNLCTTLLTEWVKQKDPDGKLRATLREIRAHVRD